MSEQQPDKVKPGQNEKSAPKAAATAAAAPTSAADAEQLANLMAEGERGKQPPRPDLEGQALRAAEAALLQGQQALAAAREQLASPEAPKVSRRREKVLRVLLGVNLLLMVAVLLVPTGEIAPSPRPVTEHVTPAPVTEPQHPVTNSEDPYLRALEAANRGDYGAALAGLDAYVAAAPRLAPGRLMLVRQAQAYYARMLGDDKRSENYERQAAALLQSHTLPEDLLDMAKNAEERGDAEAMRRIYARFLLQQRQIPASLYKHIAEAYLKLGDSYRTAAEQGAEAQRLQELQQLRGELRKADEVGPPSKPGGGR